MLVSYVWLRNLNGFTMVSKRLGLADVNATREQVESLTKHPREGDSEPTRMGAVEPDTREHGLQPYIVPSRVGGVSG
jgi:hypothetical protein